MGPQKKSLPLSPHAAQIPRGAIVFPIAKNKMPHLPPALAAMRRRAPGGAGPGTTAPTAT
jgi:hypothetical protein